MADYSEHIRFLVYLLIPVLILFTFAVGFQWLRIWYAALFATIVIVGVILVLARFGGDLPPTG